MFRMGVRKVIRMRTMLTGERETEVQTLLHVITTLIPIVVERLVLSSKASRANILEDLSLKMSMLLNHMVVFQETMTNYNRWLHGTEATQDAMR